MSDLFQKSLFTNRLDTVIIIIECRKIQICQWKENAKYIRLNHLFPVDGVPLQNIEYFVV